MATHFCPNAATCLAAAVALLASSTIQAGSQPFVVVSHSAIYNGSTSDVYFSATFNEPFLPVQGSPVLMNGPTAFQYFTPDSSIRGGDSSTAIVIRSYGPPTDPDFFASTGWGFIIATVPFSESGDTVTFSAPYGLFSPTPIFTYRLETYVNGEFEGSVSGTDVPEPATWATVLLGFASLGLAGYRARRAATSIA